MSGKRAFLLTFVAALGLFLAVEGFASFIAASGNSHESRAKAAHGESPGRLRARNAELKKAIERLSPKGVHIVVDTSANVLLLKNGLRTLRRAVISSGSGNVLEEPGGDRRWVFDTPRGEYMVKSKVVNPAWVKPDWAFIEEGKDIPKNPGERIEPNVLGDYALGFGNGYFIHGTLYTRLLGRNVTHGCIRVGDEDLKVLFKSCAVGTRVIIF